MHSAHPSAMMNQMLPIGMEQQNLMTFPILQVEVKLRVPDQLVGRLIGKNGICLKKIMEDTQSHISISDPRDPRIQQEIHAYQTPELLDRIITIRGMSFGAVQAAEKNVQQKLRQFYDQDQAGAGGGPVQHQSLQQQSYCQTPAGMLLNTMDNMGAYNMAGAQMLSRDNAAAAYQAAAAYSAPQCIPMGVSPQSFYIQNPAAAAAATNFQIPTGQFAHNYQMPNLPNSVLIKSRVYVPNQIVGILIGTKGQTIKSVIADSGAIISIEGDRDQQHKKFKRETASVQSSATAAVGDANVVVEVEGDQLLQQQQNVPEILKQKPEVANDQQSGDDHVDEDEREHQKQPKSAVVVLFADEESEERQQTVTAIGEEENNNNNGQATADDEEDDDRKSAITAQSTITAAEEPPVETTRKVLLMKKKKAGVEADEVAVFALGGEDQQDGDDEHEQKQQQPPKSEEKKDVEQQMNTAKDVLSNEQQQLQMENNNKNIGEDVDDENNSANNNSQKAVAEQVVAMAPDVADPASAVAEAEDDVAAVTNGTKGMALTTTANNNHQHPHQYGQGSSAASPSERSVFIQGYDFQVQKAQYWVFQKVADSQNKHPDEIQLTCEAIVPSKVIGRIIGKGGHNVKQLQQRSGAHIKVPDNINANDKNCVEAAVRIVGNFYAVQTVQHHFGALITEAEWRESREYDHERRMRCREAGSR